MSPVESISTALHDAAHAYEPNVAAAVNGALARGRRGRRNRRIAHAAGSTAAVVAVGAASVFVAGGAGKNAAPDAVTSKPAPTKATSSAAEAPSKWPAMASTDKVLDIRMHLPALLQQMLPSGTKVAAAPKEWTTFGGAVFEATNATGSSEVHVWTAPMSAAGDTAEYRKDYCGTMGGTTSKPCETRKVPGGTVYIANTDKTAADDAGGKPDPGYYQAGHENDVVWRGQQMTFVPDDRGKSVFQIQETTQVEAVPYASAAPKGSETYQWPPTNNDVKTAVGTDLVISADDFAALVGKPQIAQIARLLDTAVPPSQSAVAERENIDAQLAKLAGPVLPPGVKLTVNYMDAQGGLLVLTGPTGVNGFQWYTDKRSHGLLATNNLTCRPEDANCVQKKVDGATVQWSDGISDPQHRMSTFEYVPDAPDGKEVSIMFFAGDPRAEPPGDEPQPKPAPAQLTYNQMLTIVTSPGIADIMQATTLLGK